jgi:hypothetical protein
MIIKFLNPKYWSIIFGIIAFVYFINDGIKKETNASETELKTINGCLKDYKFINNSGSRGQGNDYSIWLDNYKNPFQISADFLKVFQRRNFLLNTSIGDSVILTIPNKQIDRLNSAESVTLMSIKSKGKVYLNEFNTLEIEKHNADSKGEFLLAFIFLIGGLAKYWYNERNN